MASDTSSKRLPWRKHYCGDFLGRAGRWPYEAIGCYMVLLDLLYLNGPMSDTELDANLAPLSEGSRGLVRSVLQRTDEGWTHHRVEQDRAHSAHVSQVRREARLGTNRNNDASSAAQVQHNCAQDAHKTASASVLVSDSVSASRKGDARGKVAWTAAGGFTGITDEDRAGWAEAYPAVNIDRQLAGMHQWLLSNPSKARKSNWRQFVTNWLSRKQDRGGDTPSAQVSRFTETRRAESSEEKSERIRRESAEQLARIAARRAASATNGTTNAPTDTPNKERVPGTF